MTPFQFNHPVNLTMGEDEHWLVVGANGSGKSFLTKLICSAFMLREGTITYKFSDSTSSNVSENIVSISFRDQYGDMSQPPFYQFRWNQGLHGDELPTVADVLSQTAKRSIDHSDPAAESVCDLLNKPIVILSSGEFRRFQIARAIINRPTLLILDNPLIGLDYVNRQNVVRFLQELISSHKVHVILNLPALSEPIDGFTHVIEISQGEIEKKSLPEYQTYKKIYGTSEKPSRTYDDANTSSTAPLQFFDETDTERANRKVIVNLSDVTIRYGKRTILNHITWSVTQGERWALTGANGSGKSTLLSLICADNPQSYACNITLFGSRRGSGESIWDIKRHIGYVSPEMFRTYLKPQPAKQIVASGLFDTVGLYQHPKDYKPVFDWMERFKISDMADKIFTKLSDGEQRMILLARAFVKNPDLLVLDEPFHGLDDNNRRMAKCIIDEYCKDRDKTLIMVSHYDEDFPTCITHKLTLQKND